MGLCEQCAACPDHAAHLCPLPQYAQMLNILNKEGIAFFRCKRDKPWNAAVHHIPIGCNPTKSENDWRTRAKQRGTPWTASRNAISPVWLVAEYNGFLNATPSATKCAQNLEKALPSQHFGAISNRHRNRSLTIAMWWAGVQLRLGGGGGRYSPLARPPPLKKGSIDGPPKILPRLTPGPRRCSGSQNLAKNENGFFGISASRRHTR